MNGIPDLASSPEWCGGVGAPVAVDWAGEASGVPESVPNSACQNSVLRRRPSHPLHWAPPIGRVVAVLGRTEPPHSRCDWASVARTLEVATCNGCSNTV